MLKIEIANFRPCIVIGRIWSPNTDTFLPRGIRFAWGNRPLIPWRA